VNYAIMYYLISLCDSTKHISGVASGILGILSVGGICWWISTVSDVGFYNKYGSETKLEKANEAVKVAKRSTIFILVLLCMAITLTILVPNKRDSIIIAGLHTGATTLDKAAEIPPKLMDLINKELDERLKGE